MTSIPVDQLGALTVTVTGSQPFKNLFAGQWGGIDQSFDLRGRIFDKGDSAPDVQGSGNWGEAQLAATSRDSSWASKTSASRSMNEIARAMNLYKASTKQNISFTARFSRRSYTGKTIWKDGGWVKETIWETLGTPVGQANLKLEPPRSAASIPFAALFAKATANPDRAEMAAKELLRAPDQSGGSFSDSKFLKIERRTGEEIVYNWNYDGDKTLVYANIPATATLHAAATNIATAMMPISKSADFVCPLAVTVKQVVGGPWEVVDLDLGSGFRAACRTTDGRTADQVSGGTDPAAMLKGDPNKSAQENAMDLLKQFGL